MATDNGADRPDPGALPPLESYRPYFRYVAMKFKPELGPRGALSDVVQIAMIQAESNKKQYDGNTEGQWRGWLRKIIIRVIIRFRPPGASGRRESADGIEQVAIDRGHSPTSLVREAERQRLLEECIDELPEMTRRVITLILFEGLRNVDVAKKLGLTEGKVSGHVRRGVVAIRKGLHERGYDR